MKNLLKILGIFVLLIGSYFIGYTDLYAVDNIRNEDNFSELSRDEINARNPLLMNDPNFIGQSRGVTIDGAKGIQGFILKIAKDFKNLVFALSTMVFLILVYKILFASNTEEEAAKFRKGIIWTFVGIVVMQLSFSATVILFDKDVDDGLAGDLLSDLLMPLINLLLFGAAFAFLLMGIFAFYMIITAGGDEEKAKKGKMTIFYAIIGFIVIKFAEIMVTAAYEGTYKLPGSTASATDLIGIVATIINWITPFIGLIVVIMIMYAGIQLVLGNGDEEKLKKAKRSLIYIAIGLFILAVNFLIVTFFIDPTI